jgi:succinoglycan biosynthesis transport protein ExoP
MFTRRSTDKYQPAMHNQLPRGTSLDFDIRYIINVMLARWKPILALTILAGLFGYLYLSFQKPLYTASAMVQLAANQQPLLDTEAVMLGQINNDSAIQSEMDILRSPALMRRVVERLDLDTKSEFNGDLQQKTFVWHLRREIRSLLNPAPQGPDAAKEQEERTKTAVTRAVTSRVSLNKNPLSYTVTIAFTSENAKRAQVIANSIAEEYLAYQIESATDTSRRAREWYTKRLEELQQSVIASERNVQNYSEEHNLFELDGKTLGDQQTVDVNQQLADARASLSQIEARLERARGLVKSGGGIESVSEVLNSVLIQGLRGKEADLMREKSEISAHFGPRHPQMQKINRELADLRGKINTEINKILAGMENELAITRARIQTLSNDLVSMRAGMGDETRVQLTELKREAEANRILYESFLNRSKETREAENIDQARAKIISLAETPLTPSWPRKSLILALFIVAGFMTGVMLAFVLELLSIGFTSPRQVENILGVACFGMIPEIVGNEAGTDYMIHNSASVYTESLRSILASVQFSNVQNAPKSVMIISSLPQEGKGWLSISLARVAAQAGKKVLLLDCDLHRPRVSDSFKGNPTETLNSYLSGDCSLFQAIHTDTPTGMHYIASSPHKGNIQEMLESSRMRDLMDYAHEEYDLVIMDSPPVVGISDVLYLSKLAQSTVLAIRWASTPRRIVNNALRALSRAHINLVGVVLTRVDMKQYKRFEFGDSYHYSFYNSYYLDDAPAQPSLADNIKDKIVRFSART